MTRRLRLVLACAAVLAIVGPPAARGTESAPLPVTLGPGSVLWLEGTSTMHDYESRSNAVTIEIAGDPAVAPPADAAALLAIIRGFGVHTVRVRVPVESLRSDKTALDKNLRRAMRAEEYPAVVFELREYTLTPAGDTLAIESQGTLAIAGQERPVTLEARLFVGADGLWLEGREPLRMSEYGIKPPTMMLGALKVHDPVTVHYRLLLLPSGATGAPVHPAR